MHTWDIIIRHNLGSLVLLLMGERRRRRRRRGKEEKEDHICHDESQIPWEKQQQHMHKFMKK
jgi:hypothetical protein